MEHPLDKLQEPLRRAGEAFGRAANALGVFTVSITDWANACLDAWYTMVGLPLAEHMQKKREQIKALLAASPRVRHLAQHHRKYRTRKKNINRALREYKRKEEDRDHVQATF